MKLLTFAIASAAVLACAASEAAPAPAVRMELSLDRPQYLPAEEIRLTVRFTTDSPKPIDLPDPCLATDEQDETETGIVVSIRSDKRIAYPFRGMRFDRGGWTGQVSRDKPLEVKFELIAAYLLRDHGEFTVSARYRCARTALHVASTKEAKFQIAHPTGMRVIDARVGRVDGNPALMEMDELSELDVDSRTHAVIRHFLINPAHFVMEPILCRRLEPPGMPLKEARLLSSDIGPSGAAFLIGTADGRVLLVDFGEDGATRYSVAPGPATEVTVSEDAKTGRFQLCDRAGKRIGKTLER